MARRSEFAGSDGASGLPRDKPHGALTASEKLRLVYTTGTEDPKAALDNHRTFHGLDDVFTVIPPSNIPLETE